MAARSAIIALIFACMFAFIIYGYYSTQRRLRRGQAPLAIFRWTQRPGHPSSHYPAVQHPLPPPSSTHDTHPPSNPYEQSDGLYQMEGYYAPAPPPAYNHADDVPPPVYQPREDVSKRAAGASAREVVGSSGEATSGALPPLPPVAQR